LNKKKQLAYTDLNDIVEIARRPDQRRTKMVYLSIEDMKLILEQPDISRETGMRDKFYIALLYDSGCRDQEILDLRMQDFVIKRDNEAELHIVGKGKKYRVTPITADVVKIFYEYCKIYHPDYKKEKDSYLFYTTRKDAVTQMSADNVQRFLKVYENKAMRIKPEIAHLHPHLFRHYGERNKMVSDDSKPAKLASSSSNHSPFYHCLPSEIRKSIRFLSSDQSGSSLVGRMSTYAASNAFLRVSVSALA
jgi:integrase